MKPVIALFAAFFLLAAPADAARRSLGQYERWGAFLDEAPRRCFAIAEPVSGGRSTAWASIASWPGRGAPLQLHIRLPRIAQAQSSASLSIGARRFALWGAGLDLWARDAGEDRRIVAAMRGAERMLILARDAHGRPIRASYALAGAASAIDAAAIACRPD